jgi:hypothetical protein
MELGYTGIPDSVALEFNTIQNGQTGDPNGNHVGVHTRGLLPNTTDMSASLADVTPSFRLNDGSAHQVEVDYTPGVLSIHFADDPAHDFMVGVDLATLLGLS